MKRHFRERGKDIQNEPFTAVGAGDMSGDVFGNGMLLSRHMRLLGAFNHLHVLVDPNPDPEVSWAERRRLFELPRSSWGDYDPRLIWGGGGVFDRAAKRVALSEQIRAAFGIEEEQLTPSELIRKILTADVELWWFGGIGTYVKACDETHAMVGDRRHRQVGRKPALPGLPGGPPAGRAAVGRRPQTLDAGGRQPPAEVAERLNIPMPG